MCNEDISHTENIDWGHYPETDGSKHSCQSLCFKDDNCEAYEWSDTDEKNICKWWNKGICQYGNGQKSDDPKFVSCKKLGNLLTNQSIVLCNIILTISTNTEFLFLIFFMQSIIDNCSFGSFRIRFQGA